MSPKIGIIIQARMGSTRLPGKVLTPVINEDSMLEAVVNRLKATKTTIIIATSDKPGDDPIEKLCGEHQINCFRGSENNVLERFYLAAKQFDLDIIVRITGDCPLIDPAVVMKTINEFLINDEKVDYASNVMERTYPRGLDTEVFSFNALKIAHQNATKADEREHVTSYLYTHPDLFKLKSVTHQNHANRDLSIFRLTVDTQEDLDLIRHIYTELHKDQPNDFYQASLDKIINVLDQHPEWTSINSHINQKFHSSHQYQKAKKTQTN